MSILLEYLLNLARNIRLSSGLFKELVEGVMVEVGGFGEKVGGVG